MSTLRKFRAWRARSDVNALIEYAARDERDGSRVVQAPHHRRLQQLAAQHSHLAVVGFPESAKTTQLSVWRTIYELGNDPSLTFLIAHATQSGAEKIVRAIGRTIEQNAELAAVFPNLKPGPTWTSSTLMLANAPASMTTPNVVAVGADSSGAMGYRFRRVVLDDVPTLATTRTKDARENAWLWYSLVIAPRMTPDARIISVANAWSDDDLSHRLGRLPNWQFERVSVLDDKGHSTWPQRWPLDRILERRNELGLRAFSTAYLCNPVSAETAIFQLEWLHAAVMRGTSSAPYVLSPPQGARAVCGVDPAFSTAPGADMTAIVVVINHANGHREVVECAAGRWSLDHIAARVHEISGRWKARVVVESNGGGTWLVQQLKAAGLPVTGAQTNAQNKEARVAALASELELGKWSFHCPIAPQQFPMLDESEQARLTRALATLNPEKRALLDELAKYDPNDHMGDRASALLLCLEKIRETEGRARIQWTSKQALGIRNL